METDWRKRAEAFFYLEKKSIREIAELTGMSRKSISGHLCGTSGYQAERERRKREHAESRKAYQREWDRTHRSADCYGGAVTAETIQREHDVAAMILSREKYR